MSLIENTQPVKFSLKNVRELEDDELIPVGKNGEALQQENNKGPYENEAEKITREVSTAKEKDSDGIFQI